MFREEKQQIKAEKQRLFVHDYSTSLNCLNTDNLPSEVGQEKKLK
jgi:hypothetical protein